MVIAQVLLIKLPYSRKYWRELNLVVGPEIVIAGGFKFDGSVRDRYTYVCKYELIWRLQRYM